jgi:hypothetical protein
MWTHILVEDKNINRIVRGIKSNRYYINKNPLWFKISVTRVDLLPTNRVDSNALLLHYLPALYELKDIKIL